MTFEIGTKSITYHIATEIVDYSRQLVYLCLCQELGFIYQKPVYNTAVSFIQSLSKVI